MKFSASMVFLYNQDEPNVLEITWIRAIFITKTKTRTKLLLFVY